MAIKFIKPNKIKKFKDGTGKEGVPAAKEKFSSIDPMSEDFSEAKGSFNFNKAIEYLSTQENDLSGAQKRKLIKKLQKAKKDRAGVGVEVVKNEGGDILWRWQNESNDDGRKGGVQDENKTSIGFGGKGVLGLSGKAYDEAYDYMVRKGFVAGTRTVSKKQDTVDEKMKEALAESADLPKEDDWKIEGYQRPEAKELKRRKEEASSTTTNSSNIGEVKTSTEKSKEVNSQEKVEAPYKDEAWEALQKAIEKREKFRMKDSLSDFFSPDSKKSFESDNLEDMEKSILQQDSDHSYSMDPPILENKKSTPPSKPTFIDKEGNELPMKFMPQGYYVKDDKKDEGALDLDETAENAIQGNEAVISYIKELNLKAKQLGKAYPKKSLGGVLSAVQSIAPLISSFSGKGEQAPATPPAMQSPEAGQAPSEGEIVLNGMTYIPKGDDGIKVDEDFAPKFTKMDYRRPNHGTVLKKIKSIEPSMPSIDLSKPLEKVEIPGQSQGQKAASDAGKVNTVGGTEEGSWNSADKTTPNTAGEGIINAANKIGMKPILEFITSKPVTVDAPLIPKRKFTPGRVDPTSGLSYDQIAKAKKQFAEMTSAGVPQSANPNAQIMTTIGKQNAAASVVDNLTAADQEKRSRTEQVKRAQEEMNFRRRQLVENQNQEIQYKNDANAAQNELNEKQLKQQRNSNLLVGLYNHAAKAGDMETDLAMMKDRTNYENILQQREKEYLMMEKAHGKHSPEAKKALETFKGTYDEFTGRAGDLAKKRVNSGTFGDILSSLLNK